NGSPLRCCCSADLRHQIIAPKNLLAFHIHISQLSVVQAPRPAPPSWMSISEQAVDSDLGRQLLAQVVRWRGPPAFQTVWATNACAAWAISPAPPSFSSSIPVSPLSQPTFLALLSPRVSRSA